MIQTKYGEFDGDKWEAVCQVCFKRMYEQDSYQEIKASPGDHGIEGFTRKGDAFQCYCPDKQYTQDELHENIRDKITKDLKKLVTYQKELKSKLNGIKIKRWIFVTPYYGKNQIIDHCAKKSKEYSELNLEILDSHFIVLVYDIDFLAQYLPLALKSIGEKLFIEPDNLISQDIEEFKSSGSEQAMNIINKSVSIIENIATGTRSRPSDKLAKTYIEQYLYGTSVVNRLQTKFKETYERYLRNVDQMETQLEQKQILNDVSNKELVKEITNEVIERIDVEFPELDAATKNRLSSFVVANWLANCPLRFDDI